MRYNEKAVRAGNRREALRQGGVIMTTLQHPVLGIDIGGTNMRFALVDGALHLRAYEQLSTQAVFAHGAQPTQKLAQQIRAYCARHLQGEAPAAVSIGFPSTINRARTVVLQTPNIEGIPDNYAVVQELGGELGLPVYINRDVNNLLLFDLEDLGLTDCGCVTAIYFGTGLGNAVMLGQKLLLGYHGAAAELGHLPVYGNRHVCKCGNPSCLETVVSGLALEGIQAEHFPQTPIHQLFARHMGTAVMQDFLVGMAQVVALEINLFDPDCMVLGGGLLQMEGFPCKQLEALVHRYARKPYPERDLRLRYSRPNQENGPVGAAIYAYKRMADPQYL